MATSDAVSRSDVLILGGGVIGLSCALELLRAGRSVCVLDKSNVGSGASHANCGTITPHLMPLTAPGTVKQGLHWLLKRGAPLRIAVRPDPALLRWLVAFSGNCNEHIFRRTARVKTALMRASLKRMTEVVAREDLHCEFEHHGHLIVFRDADRLAASHDELVLWRELGLTVETLDGDACRAHEPALNSSVVGGFLHPEEAHLRPDRYIAELARAVRTLGGEIHEQAEVTRCRRERARIQQVDTPAGSYRGDEVIMALGAWSPSLATQLGLRLPIQPGKGYSITYSRPTLAPVIPLSLAERMVCVTAWESGYRLGSTMEFVGFNTQLKKRRIDALKRAAREYLVEPLGPVEEERWFGWRPMTPDDLPVIGRAPGLENLTLATGHGMVGVSLSSITGLLVTELLTGHKPSLDIVPLSPVRFG